MNEKIERKALEKEPKMKKWIKIQPINIQKNWFNDKKQGGRQKDGLLDDRKTKKHIFIKTDFLINIRNYPSVVAVPCAGHYTWMMADNHYYF